MKEFIGDEYRHEKVWGSEFWLVNTPSYCAKYLDLKNGYRCSLHYHEVKDETFIVEHGKVMIEWKAPLDFRFNVDIMGVNDRIHIHPHTLHRFWGLQDSRILEVSTHHEDEDSFRIDGAESSFFTPDEFNLLYWGSFNQRLEETNATKE